MTRLRSERLVLLLAALGLLLLARSAATSPATGFSPATASASVRSSFDQGHEGWTARNSPSSSEETVAAYLSDSGNPGGAIGPFTGTDPRHGEEFTNRALVAPETFHGNQSGALGSTLSFDLYFPEQRDYDYEPFIVWLRSAARDGWLIHFGPPGRYQAGWHRINVPLSGDGWSNGTPEEISDDELRAVLGSVSALVIDLRNTGAGVRVDNVQLGQQSAPELQATPEILNLGKVKVRGTHSRSGTGTIRNTGGSAAAGEIYLDQDRQSFTLLVDDVLVDAGQSLQYTLSPGQSLSYTVIFDPEELGTDLAFVWVTNPRNEAQPELSVAVGGEGVRQEPKIRVSPGRLSFPRVRALGEHEFRKVVTVRNVGRVRATGDILLSDATGSLTLRRRGQESFLFPYDLPPGGSVRLEVVFNPSAAGRTDAELLVTNPESSTHPEIRIPVRGRGF